MPAVPLFFTDHADSGRGVFTYLSTRAEPSHAVRKQRLGDRQPVHTPQYFGDVFTFTLTVLYVSRVSVQ